MVKKIKWIFFILLVVSLIITVVMFMKFTKKNEENHNKDNNYNSNVNDDASENNDILNEIMNKEWYINLLTISENGEEYFRNDSYDSKYIILDEKIIKYCNSEGKECKTDNYIYSNNILTIQTDNTLGRGDYSIKYSEHELELSRKEENRIITYYFYLP